MHEATILEHKISSSPGDLGAHGFNRGKVSIVVEIDTPVVVGKFVEGGNAILSRLPVDNVPEKKGEFYLRQFLSDEEATLILSLIPNHLGKKTNHLVAAFRQMSTFQNLLDLTRRCIKESLSRLLSIEIHCVPISGKHRWDLEDPEREREETILLAISTFKGGDQLIADIMHPCLLPP